jgi:hypothetical protein
LSKDKDSLKHASSGDKLDSMREICGDEVASKVGAVWGMDEEGQLQGVWRHSGHDGLWFGMGMCVFLLWALQLTAFWAGNLQVSRFHSIHLAMRESSSLGSIVSSVADASI